MLRKSNAIILKCLDFQESSKILTVLSEDKGKFGLIAKGAKRRKSKFSGYVELGNIVELNYTYKSSRALQPLTDIGLLHNTSSIRFTIPKLSLMMRTLEMVDQIIHDGEESPDIYLFLYRFLVWLHQTKMNVTTGFPYVLIRLAALSGIGIQKEHSVSDQVQCYLNSEIGTLDTHSYGGVSFLLTPAQSDYVQRALQGNDATLMNYPFANEEQKNLIHHLDVYFKQHFDTVRDRKSDSIFDQL